MTLNAKWSKMSPWEPAKNRLLQAFQQTLNNYENENTKSVQKN